MVTILILGPGYPPSQKKMRDDMRRIIQKTSSASVVIMENLGLDEKRPLYQLFHEMLDEHDPDLIVVLYTKRGFSNAVDFELGALTCRDPPVLDRLLIMVQNGASEVRITRYVRNGLMHDAKLYGFVGAKDAATMALKKAKINKGIDLTRYK